MHGVNVANEERDWLREASVFVYYTTRSNSELHRGIKQKLRALNINYGYCTVLSLGVLDPSIRVSLPFYGLVLCVRWLLLFLLEF